MFESRSSDSAGSDMSGTVTHSFDIASSHPMKTHGTSLVHDNRKEWTSGAKTSETSYAIDGGALRKVSGTDWSHSTELDYGTDATAVKRRQVYKSGRVYGVDESSVPEENKKDTVSDHHPKPGAAASVVRDGEGR